MNQQQVNSLARRRGIYRPAYDIYGGLAGFVDYGPVGVRLRRRLLALWRQHYVIAGGYLELEGPLVGPEALFRASGHLSEFDDALVECLACSKLHRADHLQPTAEGLRDEALVRAMEGVTCPACGGDLAEPRPFNLMFATRVGAGRGQPGYLRPETAQAIFQAFPWLLRQNRGKLPLAVAQTGRSYRNEIAPRQGLLRMREFTQMEVEHFFLPDAEPALPEELAGVELRLRPTVSAGAESADVKSGDRESETVTTGAALANGIITSPLVATHLARAQRFLLAAGLPADRLRWRQHGPREIAHYSRDCWDGEVATSVGWVEVIGVADRGDYDLRAHGEASGAELRVAVPGSEREVTRQVFDRGALGRRFRSQAGDILAQLEGRTPVPGAVMTAGGEKIELDDSLFITKTVREIERVYPYVVEPSLGLDRLLYCLLETVARETDERTWLALPRAVSPYDALVAPLMNRDGLAARARELQRRGLEQGLDLLYDEPGSIGRRYARADEIGIYYAITIDYQTLEDGTVTLRDRDTTVQRRLDPDEVLGEIGRGMGW